MKEVKVAYMDGYAGLKENIEKRLAGRVRLVESDTPDYIFCSCFGHKAIYEDGIRILHIGENVTPDFNLYDYAIGFDDMDFGDRYLRFPLYAFSYREEYEMALDKHHSFTSQMLESKTKFCNFIVSHGRDTDERTIFFKKLCQYKQVDSCGSYLNNIGAQIGTTLEDKRNFQKQCKFTLAFENCSMRGYTTEKLIEAWAAGTVPIYWGNPDIAKEFNTKAFINCHDYSDFDEVIEVIKRIDQDDKLYMEMMKEPILSENSKAVQYINDDKLTLFLENIFMQEKKNAYRRASHNGRLAADYEKELQKRYAYVLPKEKASMYSRIKQKVKRMVSQ